MPALWQSSQRPMYVRTVWVDGIRHAILTHDDPYITKLRAKRRPNSSASCTTKKNSSRLSHHSDNLGDCLLKLNLIIKSDKSIFTKRPQSSHEEIEKLNLTDVKTESDEELILKASPQPLNENITYDSFCVNMKNLRANKTARTEVKENTELSDRVLQWLDLAGKVDLLAPENVERMSQPRHSWPDTEVQRKNYNMSKSKTAIDINKEGGKTLSPKACDSQKAQQSGSIDRHELYVPTSANTIENYARQSRNAKITPRNETTAKTKDNPKKTTPRDLRANVMETRQKMVTERNAVQKQYAELINKKLIPDVSKNVKKQVHIFMPDMPKKPVSDATSRAESLLSQISCKIVKH